MPLHWVGEVRSAMSVMSLGCGSALCRYTGQGAVRCGVILGRGQCDVALYWTGGSAMADVALYFAGAIVITIAARHLQLPAAGSCDEQSYCGPKIGNSLQAS